MEYLIGKKLKMSQLWKDDKVIPVTLIQTEQDPILEIGDLIKVSGTSKGRGFQGVVKRHGFSGGPKTHGQKNRLRAPGSIGSTALQRVVPGRRMAGRMGSQRVTFKNLTVVEIDKGKGLVFLKGAIPGRKNSKVELYKL